MKRKHCLKGIAAVLVCLILTACGGPSPEKVNMAATKYAELEELFNRVAPIVVALDDASVEIYDAAGETVRTAAQAAENGYDGYDDEALDKLLVDMDTALLSLKSLENMEPVKEEQPKEGEKTYAVSLVNSTEKVFKAVTLKSASGSYDIAVALTGDFVKDGAVSVSAQVPESEAFTVIASDAEGTQITFGGSFYLSAVQKITLTQEEDVFKTVIEANVAEEKPAE